MTSHQIHNEMLRCADWDGLRDHLRNVLWDDISKLSAPAAAAIDFCVLV